MTSFKAATFHVRPTALAVGILAVALIILTPAFAAGERQSNATDEKAKFSRVSGKSGKSAKSARTATSATSSLVVTGSSTSTISLEWAPPSTKTTTYNVVRNGRKIASTRRTTVMVDSLACGTLYKLRIDAVRGSTIQLTVGEVVTPTMECAPTPVPPLGVARDAQAPTVPAALAQTSATTTSVSVSWSASTDDVGVVGYGVYVNGTAVASQAGTGFVLDSLTCGTSRTLGVDAVDAAGNRSARVEIGAATAACPTAAPPPPTSALPLTSPPPPTPNPVTCDAVASPGQGTAQALVGRLSAGQVGCLRGGTYTASGTYVLDLSKSGVTLVSYPGETAILQGLIVNRNGANNVRLAELRIEGQAGASNSIQVYGADFVLEGSDVTNGWRGRSCVMLGDPSAGTAVRPVIRGNRFHECGDPANGNKDHGIYASKVSGGLITENVFWNIAAYAIQLYPNAHDTVFSHNVVDGGGTSVRGGVIFGGESGDPSSGNTVEYNVITYAATYNIESWWGGSAGSGNVARNNCLYGGTKGDIGSAVGFTSQGNVSINPLFVNRGAHDYRLQNGSGCLQVVGYDTVAGLG